MGKYVPDQVIITGMMTTEDARLLLRILKFEHARALEIANLTFTGFDQDDAPRVDVGTLHPGVQARQRLVEYIVQALIRAGRNDVLDKAL